MKKFFVISTMIISALTASAQYEPGTLSVQPRIGGTGALMTNTPAIDAKFLGKKLDSEPTGGVIVGADLEYQLSSKVSLSAGVNWAQAGSGWKNFKDKDNGMTLEIKDLKIETSYLNVPITANFYIWKGLAIRSGVQFGFLTSAKYKATMQISGKDSGVNVNSTTDVDESCKDEFEKFDLSIPVGLSYEFNNHLVIDMRYNIGVTKVNKESVDGVKDSRNGVLALTIGYKLKL